jgi:hypothetical protein
MSKSEKKLDSMRNNPRDWQISDVETVARAYGVTVRKGAGSHVVFSYPGVRMIVTIPAHRPIKAPYIRDFVEFIDSIDPEAK